MKEELIGELVRTGQGAGTGAGPPPEGGEEQGPDGPGLKPTSASSSCVALSK